MRDKFGITGSAHDWIESFLSGRTQQVYYKGRLSAVTLLLYGGLRDRSCALPALCCRSPQRHHGMWTTYVDDIQAHVSVPAIHQ